MELSNEQRELLSAYLDGEVNAAERALAQALLVRPGAAQYLADLKRVRELAHQHGAARAPQNFATLVRQALEGDFDGISRPTSNQGDYDGLSRPTSNQAPIHNLPVATWRMPLLAAAAAIVMALSIFAFNALMVPGVTPTEVAKGGGTTARPAGEPSNGNIAVNDEYNEAPAEDSAEELKKAVSELGRVQDGAERSRKKDPEAQKPADAKEEGKSDYAREKAAENRGKELDDRKDKDRNSTPDKKNEWHGDAEDGGTGGGGSSGKVGASGGGSPGASDSKGEKPKTKAARGTEHKQGDNKPEESPAPPEAPAKNPPKPDQGEPDLRKPATDAQAEPVEEVTIEVSSSRDADAPSVATDVMQVASVYGTAKASTDENGTTIEVEVDEDKVDEMVKALDKLAKDQDAGNTKPSGAEQPGASRPRREAEKSEKGADDKVESERAQPSRARDYLPSEARRAAERNEAGKEAAGPAEGGPKDETKESDEPKTASPKRAEAPKKKVRVILRLK